MKRRPARPARCRSNFRADGAARRSPTRSRRAQAAGSRRARPRSPDRRPDAGLPGLRRRLLAARRAAHQGGARRRTASAARRSPTSQFLPTLDWLDAADVVRQRLGGQRRGGTASADGPPAPGLHGHGLDSASSVGGMTLQPGAGVNRDPGGASLTFTVKFQNQGENDETRRRRARSTVTAGRQADHRRARRSTQTNAEQHGRRSTIPLGQTPPTGQPVTIKVAVAPVPGEKNTDNNKQTYTGHLHAAESARPAAAAGPTSPRGRPRARPPASSRWPLRRRSRARRASLVARAAAAACARDQRAVLGERGARGPRRPRRRRSQRDFRALHDYVEDVAPRLDGAAGRRRGAPRRRDRLPRPGPLRRLQRDVRPPVDLDRAARRPRARASSSRSIHHRDQARLYAKQVVDGHGELELSPEEDEAVRLALAGEPADDAGARR